jgi:hypothetical protein
MRRRVLENLVIETFHWLPKDVFNMSDRKLREILTHIYKLKSN